MKLSPALQTVYDCQTKSTPKLQKAIDNRLNSSHENEHEFMEVIASLILKRTGNELEQYCKDFQWMCDAFFAEEVYFRRNGSYRLKRYQDAYEQVYSNPAVMGPYVNGILMSQLWWRNHTRSMDFFRSEFLKTCVNEASLLEVGPGHGLLMYFAASEPRCARIEGWDISDSSIAATKDSLAKLGVTREIHLKNQSLFDAPASLAQYDAIVFSEVLEHFEAPNECQRALQKLQQCLKPGGQIYINMPINSPAPDHLFNLPSTESMIGFVEDCGLVVTNKNFVPMTDYSLEKAEKQKATISCLVIAKPAGRDPA